MTPQENFNEKLQNELFESLTKFFFHLVTFLILNDIIIISMKQPFPTLTYFHKNTFNLLVKNKHEFV